MRDSDQQHIYQVNLLSHHKTVFDWATWLNYECNDSKISYICESENTDISLRAEAS